MMTRHSLWSLVRACPCVLGLLILSSTGVARGQDTPGQDPPDDSARERSRKLFYEGVALFDRGRYAEACARLQDSLLLHAGTGTRGKLAECYEKRGMLASAYELYREVERLAREVGDERARVARERANELEPRVPRLIIEPGSSARLSGFEISLDGKPLKLSSLGIALFVDPGSRVITASAPGHETWSVTVQADLGKTRSIQLPPLQLARDDGGGSGRLRTTGWILLGTGAVTTAVGLGFGTYALANNDDFEVANTPATISTYTTTAGIVVAATGGAMIWLTRRDSGGEQRSAVIVPVLTDGEAGVQVLGRF